ncbi:phosphopentomutase [Coralliovum pocilloporae]|uniref:phosphopentomutase n=1 Tax=Coralliovum pocilloporae TaxID=3066369 RepID=UPI003307C15F
MARAFLMVMDSFGIGGAPDAAAFGDEGADTFGHIAEACAEGRADVPGLRHGPLLLPNLQRLGLLEAARKVAGKTVASLGFEGEITGFWGAAHEISNGKDTPSGHWELAGVPVTFDWGYFPDTRPSFPEDFTRAFIREARLPGILGDCHASGTVIIDEFGEEHVRSGKPICYTSADSVLQIAAHEEHFGLERLYDICAIAREMLYDLNIGRVIARPFVGEDRASFERTANRRDFSVLPPAPTLLDRAKAAGRSVHAVGKLNDIFAGQGVTDVHKAAGTDALFDLTLSLVDTARDGDLVFVNFVDFDTLYGHRRDIPGYAAALEAFDARLPELEARLRPGDLAVLTADHGCDPSWHGTEHTREQVPFLAFGPGLEAGEARDSMTFSDIGASVAHHLDIDQGPVGRSVWI